MTTRRWFLGGIAAGVVLLCFVSCGPGKPAASLRRPPNPVEGLITAIEGMTLELRTDRRSYRFEIGDPTVPADHLRAHLRDELPVLITWHAEGNNLVATTIADAPA